MSPIYYQSLAEIARKIHAKEISPREVVEHQTKRATQLQSRLNAFVHFDEIGARNQSELAEMAVQRGDALGPLHGVPLSVKSCIDVAGWLCPAGSLLRKENRPCGDAILVQRLHNAGAVLLGIFNGV